jgi:hypothetical protein
MRVETLGELSLASRGSTPTYELTLFSYRAAMLLPGYGYTSLASVLKYAATDELKK